MHNAARVDSKVPSSRHADIGAPKTIAATPPNGQHRHITALVMPALTPTGGHSELHDVDLIIDSVDHDGPTATP
jgi:hypothetical protein